MSTGFGVRTTNTKNGSSLERLFPQLPIRIGRNSQNDFVLDLPFISEFHAVIDQHENQVFLQDLGSTNGIFLPSGERLKANERVPLSQIGFKFAILHMLFTVRSTAAEQPGAAPEPGAIAPPAAVPPLPHAAAQLHQTPGGPLQHTPAPNQGPSPAELQGAYDHYRKAWSQLMGQIHSSLGGLPAEQQIAHLQGLSRPMPALLQEPDFQRLAASLGAPIPNTNHQTSRVEAAALRGVTELASQLIPTQPPPETLDELNLFLAKLKELLGVFLRGFIPLRDGRNKFLEEINLRQSAELQSAQRLVLQAETPEQLASALLNWRAPLDNGCASVERSLSELMLHQVGMINGVMQGVKTLLGELSPQTVERLLDAPSSSKARGIAVGPFRFKSLWQLYEERYGDLASEEKQVFSIIFGEAFSAAYTQYLPKRAPHLATQAFRAAPPQDLFRNKPE